MSFPNFAGEETPESLRDKLEGLSGEERLSVEAVKGAAQVATDPTTNQTVIVGPDGLPLAPSPAIRKSIASRKPWGVSGNLSVSGMMLLSMQAPAAFKAVQLVVYGQNCEGIRASAAPSSIKGNLFDAKAADGTTALAPTEFTWGTTDINDISNPGGGSSTGAITDAVGAFTYPLDQSTYKQGSAATDWMWLDSLPRVDDPTAKPLVFARWFAAHDTPTGNRTPGWRNRSGESLGGRDEFWPEMAMTYVTNQSQLTSSTLTAAQVVGKDENGVISSTNQHYANGMLRFLLDIPTSTFATFGDSHLAGYIAGGVNTWGANGLGGWVSMLVRNFVNAGIPANLLQSAMATDLSENFHARAKKAIQQKQATHYFIQMRSVNDNTGQNAQGAARRLTAAIQRTTELVSMAYQSGGQPIVIQPWTANAAQEQTIRNAALVLAGQGVKVVDIPGIICLADRVTLKPGYVVPGDSAHYNRAAHEAIELHVRLGGYIN